MELIEQDVELYSQLFRPPEPSTFRVVLPDGHIREFEGLITSHSIMTDGTMPVDVLITSPVREGSIYEPEGAD
jgi:hypothetical protein